MNKIANWVFGSFFRTIGRLLVFVVLGFIIAHFIDFGNIIDNFRITDLFFERPKAAGIARSIYINNMYNSNGAALSGSNYFGDGVYTGYTNGQTSVYFNNQHTTSGTGVSISSSTQFKEIVFLTAFVTISEVTQSQQSVGAIASYSLLGSLYSVQICKVEPIEYNFGRPDTNSSNVIYANITCPIPITTQNIYLSRLALQGASTADVFQTFHINKNATLILNDNYILQEEQQQTNQAITNQTQQQQQQHQQMMDDNTTQAEDDATDFFDGFSVPDTGGLSAIITAPLNTIRSLLNSSCTNLVLPLPYVNEDLTLPCMNTIYSEHFGAFYTLYQTIILAIIAYRCIRSIFFDLHGFTNPDDDRIEVMDL